MVRTTAELGMFLLLIARIRYLKKKHKTTKDLLNYSDEKLDHLINMSDANALARFLDEVETDAEFFDIANNLKVKKS